MISSDGTPVISDLSAHLSITNSAMVTATISGSNLIYEGQSINLTINFTGTTPYTYAINNGANQSTSTNSLNIPISPNSTTNYTITSLSNTCGNGTISGSAIITVLPVSSRLISCFPFNGNANDSKGLNNAIVSVAALTSDRFGNPNSAYSFDGTNSKIYKETSSGILNDEYTFSMWFNPSSTQASGTKYELLNLAYNTFELAKRQDGKYFIQYYGYSNFGSDGGAFLLTNFSPDTWHHICFVRGYGIFTLYIDNILIGSGTPPFDYYQAHYGYPYPIEIGMLGSGYYAFLGKIDDIQIYKGALSAAQVQTLYSNTNSCFDSSASPCLTDVTYNSILNGQQILQVSNKITGSNVIQTNSIIHFDSKKLIILEPGFKTESNSVFKATVGGGCNN